MDPYPFNVNTASELRLRWHIREILLPYARAHLTLDYLVYTEKVVEEILLQTLEYVPMTDATSFRLPSEPIEVLMHSLNSLDLAPPEERWTTLSEHIRYLKAFIPPHRPHDLPTEKYWLEDDDYMRLSLICRPMSSPVLSKRARDETLALGSTALRAATPHTRSTLNAFLGLSPAPVQNVPDLSVPPMDDILGLHLQLDAATGAQIRSFIQSTSVPSMNSCFDDTPNVPAFLRHASPPRPPPSLDSPPIFSRIAQDRSVQRCSNKDGTSNPSCASDLASILQVASPQLIDSEDGDINDHLMEVASGWTTLIYSSPVPPSLHSSDGSSIDKVWDMSSPGTPPTSSMAVMMDEVEIPRVRKFGHKDTLVDEIPGDDSATSLLAAANSPGFFITSFISAPIPMTQKPVTPQLEGVGIGTLPPCSLSPGLSTSNSLLGHPSLPGEQIKGEKETLTTTLDCVEGFEEQPLDDAVASIYASTPQDPLSYIMEERIDEKDIMLMDVPNLPPPTAHPRDPSHFPEGLQCFVAPREGLASPVAASQAVNCVGLTTFLRPVKGIKPLALDLSWRPFNFGKATPTDEEVAGIARAIQPEDELPGCRDKKYEKTINALIDLGTRSTLVEDTQATLLPTYPRGCEEFGTSPTAKRAEESVHTEYLLIRRERTRVSGTKPTFTGVEAQSDTDAEQDAQLSNDGYGDLQHDYLCFPDERYSQDVFNPVELCSREQTGHIYPFDSSRVDIIDYNLGQFSPGEFAIPHLLQPYQDSLLHDVDTAVSTKESIDNSSENKENDPPGNVGHYYLGESEAEDLATQYDWSGYVEFPEPETFEPLSFAPETQPLPSRDHTDSKAQDIHPLTPNACPVERLEDHLHSVSTSEGTSTRATKRRKLDELVPTSSQDLFSTFVGLRNQAALGHILEDAGARNDTLALHQALDVSEQILPRATPDDVFDPHTVRLPEPWIPAAAVHRYLASVSLIQKRALVHELQGRHCQVDLVERHDLGGTDIIIDPDSGVLFIPLLALPAHLDSTLERISRESWRYTSLLIVLEAFPSSHSHRVDCSRDSKLVPYAYTPPTCKAVKKLRRNLAIAEGCGSLDSRCTITWAFANDIEEAAKFVRCFAEEARAISKERGREILWDEREWLEEEEREGESDLARVPGMNAFAAFVMLYDRTIEAVLDLSPVARLTDFGQLLGEQRMTTLNSVIEGRMQNMGADIENSVVEPAC